MYRTRILISFFVISIFLNYFTLPEKNFTIRKALNSQYNDILMVCHPISVGVRVATEKFPFQLFYNDEYTDKTKTFLKNKIRREKISIIIVSGIIKNYIEAVNELKAMGIKKVIFIYHGSAALLQDGKKERQLFYKLHHSKDIDHIAYVKCGMAQIMNGLYLPLFIEPQPSIQMKHMNNEQIHIGIFTEHWYIKNFHTQLFAACAIENAVIHVSQLPSDTFIPRGCIIRDHKGVNHEQLQKLLGQMDVNLYVSLAESGAQVFWESLKQGTPCLRSHFMQLYDPTLQEKLTVLDSSNIEEISKKIYSVININLKNHIEYEFQQQHLNFQKQFKKFISTIKHNPIV